MANKKQSIAKNTKKTAVIIISLSIIIVILIGYICYDKFFKNKHAGFAGRNFQLSESQINDITSFFNSNASLDEVKSYCAENMANCFYYCRNINPNHEICKELSNYTRGRVQGGPPQQ